LQEKRETLVIDDDVIIDYFIVMCICIIYSGSIYPSGQKK